MQRGRRRGGTCADLLGADLRPDRALVGTEAPLPGWARHRGLGAGLFADRAVDPRPELVVDLAPRGEVRTAVPAMCLETAHRDPGRRIGGEPHRDVDDPVLLATGDRVAGEEDD